MGVRVVRGAAALGALAGRVVRRELMALGGDAARRVGRALAGR